MKRMAFTLCALTLLAGTAPAFAGCAGMTNASSGATTTTASTPVTPKGS